VKIRVEDVFAVNEVQTTSDFPGQPVLCQPGNGDILSLEIVLKTAVLRKLHYDTGVVGQRVLCDAVELYNVVGVMDLLVHFQLSMKDDEIGSC